MYVQQTLAIPFEQLDLQGWAANSIPGIYRWHSLVFLCLANKAQMANTGKFNFFVAKYWQI